MTSSEDPPNDRYLYANGRSLLRADYPELFAAYGTTHGFDDEDTFRIPDARMRFVQGSYDNGGFLVGNTDDLVVTDRSTRHTHPIPAQTLADSQNTSTGGTAGRLQGSLGNISHNHGGQTGITGADDFPHLLLAFHVRALP